MPCAPRAKRIFYVNRPPGYQSIGTAPFEAITAATASSTKGLQTIAAETTDYSKKSFKKSRAHFEKLIGVKKIDEAIQLPSDFAKSAYEDFVAHATRIGELYSSVAKEAFKPITVTSPAQLSVVAEPSKLHRRKVASRHFPDQSRVACAAVCHRRAVESARRREANSFQTICSTSHLGQQKNARLASAHQVFFSRSDRAQRRGQLSHINCSQVYA